MNGHGTAMSSEFQTDLWNLTARVGVPVLIALCDSLRSSDVHEAMNLVFSPRVALKLDMILLLRRVISSSICPNVAPPERQFLLIAAQGLKPPRIRATLEH